MGHPNAVTLADRIHPMAAKKVVWRPKTVHRKVAFRWRLINFGTDEKLSTYYLFLKINDYWVKSLV
jgi:hypothetical protein